MSSEKGFDSIVIVKVRQSQKQIMVFYILQTKTNETHYGTIQVLHQQRGG